MKAGIREARDACGQRLDDGDFESARRRRKFPGQFKRYRFLFSDDTMKVQANAYIILGSPKCDGAGGGPIAAAHR